jgi:hypothetical protein
MTSDPTPDLATPRPWEALTTGSEGCSIVGHGRHPRVARLMNAALGTCQTDAALIVAAVNNYDRLRNVETAASILLSVANSAMPEHSPYGCPHSRDWLLGLLDDLRAAIQGGSET